jgi:hypothetical protein
MAYFDKTIFRGTLVIPRRKVEPVELKIEADQHLSVRASDHFFRRPIVERIRYFEGFLSCYPIYFAYRFPEIRNCCRQAASRNGPRGNSPGLSNRAAAAGLSIRYWRCP